MRIALLFVIVALGLSLRVVGSDWGFPFLLHPDESVVANIPADMAKRSSLDPAEYNHPDHVDIYLNAALYHAASQLVYHKPLTETFASHTLLYYRLSRILIALLGTLCIVVAWLIGREYTPNTGLIAALLVAVFPSYVNHSHFITSDIPLTLLTLATILFSVRYLKRPGNANLIFASFCAAVAVSVKYPGVLTLTMVLAVVCWQHHQDRPALLKKLGLAVAAFLLSLFLVSPYLFINFGAVVQALTANAVPVHLGADGLGWSGNLLFYLGKYRELAGYPLALCFLAALPLLLKREKACALPLCFGLVYWLALSKIGLHWERWALPMYTAPLLVSAYGIDAALERSRELSRRWLLPLGFVAVGLIVLKLLVASSVLTANLTLKDTQYAAFEYAEKSGISENNSIYEGFTPFTPGGLGYGSIVNAYGYALKSSRDFQYVIVSSAMYDRYLNEKERYWQETEFYNKIFSFPLSRQFAASADGGDGDLAKGVSYLLEFSRNRKNMLTGPTVRIYRYQAGAFPRPGDPRSAAETAVKGTP